MSELLDRAEEHSRRLEELLSALDAMQASAALVSALDACNESLAKFRGALSELGPSAQKSPGAQAARERLTRLTAIALEAASQQHRALGDELQRVSEVSRGLAALRVPETTGDACDVAG